MEEHIGTYIHTCVKTCFLVYTQENTFFYIGRLMAMTVVNCSSGYPFLAPSVYSYLCDTPLSDIVIADDEVPTIEIRNLMEKVSRCNVIVNTDC